MSTPPNQRTERARLVLREITDVVGNQTELAQAAGLDQSTLSKQLAGRRPITADHMIAYMEVAPRDLQAPLLAAWLRDRLPAECIPNVLTLPGHRIAEEVATYGIKLDDRTRSALDYIAAECATDPELALVFRTFADRMGWPGYSDDSSEA